MADAIYFSHKARSSFTRKGIHEKLNEHLRDITAPGPGHGRNPADDRVGKWRTRSVRPHGLPEGIMITPNEDGSLEYTWDAYDWAPLSEHTPGIMLGTSIEE